jgi:hypothetical protein
MTRSNGIDDMKRLEDLIDSHGADVTRWPVEDRDTMNALLRQQPAVRALLDQATALDRVLEAAPHGQTIDMAALTARIVVAAQRATAQPVGAAPQSRPKLVLVPKHAVGARSIVSYWPAMAALAASLVIGFYAGMSGWTPSGLQQVAGLSTDLTDTGTSGAVDDQPAEGIL